MGLIALIATQLTIALPTQAERAAARMPLRELAGRAILLRFNGNPAPDYVFQALGAGRAAGVILFRDNATGPDATRGLTGALQRSARGHALIATDQEGGAIRILGWAQPALGQNEITTVAGAAAAARAAARDLDDEGVNLNLAPVADGPQAIMATRAFGGDRPEQVAAAVHAYRGTGVAPTLKHFPGLGPATGNTDKQRVTVTGWSRDDLEPFGAGIDAAAPAVMVSHAIYPQLDGSSVASQSHAIVTGLLKRRLGFAGVAMTDSLEAYAVRSRMSMETAAVRSVRAGIDLVLTTGQGTYLRARRALAREARRDPRFKQRLRDAVSRVLRLQARVGRRG